MNATPTPTPTWPAFTTQSDDDVIIAAVSLVRLAALCGTPCVHSADVSRAGTHGPVDDDLASVVIARVLTTELHSDLLVHITVDADLAGCRPSLGEARIVGRRTSAPLATAVIEIPGAEGGALPCRLPADLQAGDLVVIPCSGTTRLRSITPSQRL